MLRSEDPASAQSEKGSRNVRRDAGVKTLCRIRSLGPTPTASAALAGAGEVGGRFSGLAFRCGQFLPRIDDYYPGYFLALFCVCFPQRQYILDAGVPLGDAQDQINGFLSRLTLFIS